MPDALDKPEPAPTPGIEIKEEDILEAMRAIPGYLDITPGDFKEIYRLAFQHALERLSRDVTAAEIMTKDVVAVHPDTPVAEVAAAMGRRGISGLPVVDAGNIVVGMISEKDFLSRMGAKDTKHVMGIIAACLGGRSCVAMPIRSKKAADIMAAPAITVRENTTVFEITALFNSHNINRVPVIDGQGKLIGIVSRDDLIRAPLIGLAQ